MDKSKSNPRCEVIGQSESCLWFTPPSRPRLVDWEFAMAPKRVATPMHPKDTKTDSNYFEKRFHALREIYKYNE